MIDDIDRKIIIALSKDGRRSYSELAKELGMEVITVTKRAKKMLEQKVISIKAEPNPIRMGNVVMVWIALDVEISRLEQICDELTCINNISAVLTTFGKYPILVFAEYSEISMLYRSINQQIFKIKGMRSVEVFLMLKNRFIQTNTNAEDDNSVKPTPIDDIDRSLINELQIDGRIKFSTLAKKYELSLSTVSRRIHYLIDNQIIRLTVFVNPGWLGEKVVAYAGLQVDLEHIDEISSQISRFPEIESLVVITGRYNILAIIVVPNLESLSDFFVNKLAKINGIYYFDPFIRAKRIKRTYTNVEDMFR